MRYGRAIVRLPRQLGFGKTYTAQTRGRFGDRRVQITNVVSGKLATKEIQAEVANLLPDTDASVAPTNARLFPSQVKR